MNECYEHVLHSIMVTIRLEGSQHRAWRMAHPARHIARLAVVGCRLFPHHAPEGHVHVKGSHLTLLQQGTLGERQAGRVPWACITWEAAEREKVPCNNSRIMAQAADFFNVIQLSQSIRQERICNVVLDISSTGIFVEDIGAKAFVSSVVYVPKSTLFDLTCSNKASR